MTVAARILVGLFAALAVLPGRAPAAGPLVFVAVEKGDRVKLGVLRLDEATGALTAVEGSPLDVGEVSPQKADVVATRDGAAAFLVGVNLIAPVSVDRVTGKPTAGTSTTAGVARSIRAAMDPGGRFLYVLNEDPSSPAGDSVMGYAVPAGGRALTPLATGFPAKLEKTPESLATGSMGGRPVLLASMAWSNRVAGYFIDERSGGLTPLEGSLELGEKEDRVTTVAIDRDGAAPVAWAALRSGQVQAIKLVGDALEPMGKAVKAGGTDSHPGALLPVTTPHGRFLFVRTAGLADDAPNVWGFGLAQDGSIGQPISGLPKLVGKGLLPALAADPAGRFLLVSHAGFSDEVHVLAIGAGGTLTAVPGSPFGFGSGSIHRIFVPLAGSAVTVLATPSPRPSASASVAPPSPPAPAAPSPPRATAELIKLIGEGSEARITEASSSYDEEYDAKYLVDGDPDTVWCSASGARFPHRIVFELPASSTPTEVSFVNARRDEKEYKGISAKSVQLSVSPTGKRGSWKEVGAFKLSKKKKAEQTFAVETEASGRFVELVISANHGNDEFTELAEITVRGRGAR